jgi:hypothetical protein
LIDLLLLFAPHAIKQAVALIREIPLSPTSRIGLREILVRMGGHHLSRVFGVGMVLVADKLVVLAVQAAEPVTDRQFLDYRIAAR